MPIEFTPASQRVATSLGQLPPGTSHVRRIARPLNGLEVGQLLRSTIEQLELEDRQGGRSWPQDWAERLDTELVRHTIIGRPHLTWPAVNLLVTADHVGQLWRLGAVVRLSDKVTLLINIEIDDTDPAEWSSERFVGSSDKPDELRELAGLPAQVEVTDAVGKKKRLDLIPAQSPAPQPVTQTPALQPTPQVPEPCSEPKSPPAPPVHDLLPESATPASEPPAPSSASSLPPRVSVGARTPRLSTRGNR